MRAGAVAAARRGEITVGILVVVNCLGSKKESGVVAGVPADAIDVEAETGKLRGNHLQCAELRDLPKAEYEEQLDYLGLVCSD